MIQTHDGANLDPENVDVAILCGGLGTRLNLGEDAPPKPMAELNDRPFLDLLIDYISGFGFRRFILCSGFKSRAIESYYKKKGGGRVYLVSHEPKPLGTGGALKNAETLISSGRVLVCNGDSICQVDLLDFLNYHAKNNADITVALTAMPDPGDYGVTRLDADGRVINFLEKGQAQGPALVNAGVYVMDRSALAQIPGDAKISLEYEVFPRFVKRRFFGYVTDAPLIDIGTPERLESARKFFSKSNEL
ncbi:MAG: NTP transferase domain-containing protein [Nitrospinae bacterium]|nr:NTP transferase domain-containing protein [Nitrospinota bacterium]